MKKYIAVVALLVSIPFSMKAMEYSGTSDQKNECTEEEKSAYNTEATQQFTQMFTKVKEFEVDEDAIIKELENLLRQGANINGFNTKRKTILHVAAGNHHIKIMQFLLENGADPNLVDISGRTPLFIACVPNDGQKSVEAVQILLDHGAEVNDHVGLVLVEEGHIKLSVLANALCHAYCYHKMTPVAYDIVKLLIAHGACITLQDCEHIFSNVFPFEDLINNLASDQKDILRFLLIERLHHIGMNDASSIQEFTSLIQSFPLSVENRAYIAKVLEEHFSGRWHGLLNYLEYNAEKDNRIMVDAYVSTWLEKFQAMLASLCHGYLSGGHEVVVSTLPKEVLSIIIKYLVYTTVTKYIKRG